MSSRASRRRGSPTPPAAKADERRSLRSREPAGREAAEDHQEGEDRDRDADQGDDDQEARQQLAVDEFEVPEVGHQEQDQRAAILLLGDAAGREEDGGGGHEDELDEGEDPGDEFAEAGEVADVLDDPPLERGLSGGVHDDDEGRDVAGPHQEMLGLSGGGQGFATEQETGKHSNLTASIRQAPGIPGAAV